MARETEPQARNPSTADSVSSGEDVGLPNTSRRRVLRFTAAVVVMAVLVVLTGGCMFPNREQAAHRIGDAIRDMTGVNRVFVDYYVSFMVTARFRLDVSLTEQATADQAAAVAREFVEQTLAADFSDFNTVELDLNYVPEQSVSAGVQWDSTMTIDGAMDVVRVSGAADAAARAAWVWADAAQTPGIERVVSVPARGSPETSADNARVTVWVSARTDEAVLDKLIDRHPRLRSAGWRVVTPTAPSPYRDDRAYSAYGYVPTAAARRAWQAVVDQLEKPDEATATTQIPVQRKFQTTPTVAEIKLYYDVERDPDAIGSIAHEILGSLAELPGPVGVQLHLRSYYNTPTEPKRDIVVTIGDCTTATPADPLEAELRDQFEKC